MTSFITPGRQAGRTPLGGTLSRPVHTGGPQESARPDDIHATRAPATTHSGTGALVNRSQRPADSLHGDRLASPGKSKRRMKGEDSAAPVA